MAKRVVRIKETLAFILEIDGPEQDAELETLLAQMAGDGRLIELMVDTGPVEQDRVISFDRTKPPVTKLDEQRAKDRARKAKARAEAKPNEPAFHCVSCGSGSGMYHEGRGEWQCAKCQNTQSDRDSHKAGGYKSLSEVITDAHRELGQQQRAWEQEMTSRGLLCCQHCALAFPDWQTRDAHEKAQHAAGEVPADTEHKCSQCGAVFVDSADVETHREQTHGQGITKCAQCLEPVSGLDAWQCTICEAITCGASCNRDHMDKAHQPAEAETAAS